MKKCLLYIAVIFTLLGCESSSLNSNISLVKNGVMNFNKTLTVGQALDNWEYCTNRKWENFQTSNGVEVVQFTCDMENFYKCFPDMTLKSLKKSVDKINDKKSKTKEDRLKISSLDDILSVHTQYAFQFTINKDDTFQIDNVQMRYIYKDGMKTRDVSLNPIKALKFAFQNSESLRVYLGSEFEDARMNCKKGNKELALGDLIGLRYDLSRY